MSLVCFCVYMCFLWLSFGSYFPSVKSVLYYSALFLFYVSFLFIFLRCLFIFLWDRARKSIHLERWEQGSISEELGRDTVIRIYWIKKSIFHKIKVKKNWTGEYQKFKSPLDVWGQPGWHGILSPSNKMKWNAKR